MHSYHGISDVNSFSLQQSVYVSIVSLIKLLQNIEYNNTYLAIMELIWEGKVSL